MKTVIWWIRRDLRLEDNKALAQALSESANVIPLYILDPYLLKREAPTRKAFLFNALNALNAELIRIGSRLTIREGNVLTELQKVSEASGSQKVYAEADFSPYAKARDAKAAEVLNCEFMPGLTIHPPPVIRKADGSPYTIFTPFMHAWKALPKPGNPLRPPDHLNPPVPLESVAIPVAEPSPFFPASEAAARQRLDEFMSERISSYGINRDRMDLDGTSALSSYLRLGLISSRTLASKAWQIIEHAETIEVKKSAEAWLNELIWRDFYFSIMDNFPFVLKQSFKNTLRRIPWRESKNDLQAWKDGLTGYPVVDAAMRQLRETGWMHNRARMITASFLTKDLLINWQSGESWFMEQLIDGEPASNNGGWQWSAGTGTDAAPYFRIFNPVLQGRKFDPQGAYVRRWVPELANVPGKFIHTPWEMPASLQKEIGLRIGRDYPTPIVDHNDARKRTLAAYAFSRSAK